MVVDPAVMEAIAGLDGDLVDSDPGFQVFVDLLGGQEESAAWAASRSSCTACRLASLDVSG